MRYGHFGSRVIEVAIAYGARGLGDAGSAVRYPAIDCFFEIVRCIQLTAGGKVEDREGLVSGLEAIRISAHNLPPNSPDREDLCEIATTLSGSPADGNMLSAKLLSFADRLYRECRWAEGGLALGLVAMIWAGQSIPRTFCLLASREARLFRKMRFWDQAEQLYTEAVSVAEANGIDHLWATALNGLALIRWGKGDLPGAKTLLYQVLAICERAGLHRQRARAFQDLSMAYEDMGDLKQALQANLDAYEIDFGDDEERLHILADLGVKLVKVGRRDEARVIFDKVLDESSRWSDRTNVMIELMGIDAEEGRELRFRAHQQWLAPHVSAMPPSMSVDYRVKLANGMRVFHGVAAAQKPLREAMAIAEEHGLNHWVFVVEQLLKSIQDEPTPREVTSLPLEGFTDRLLELIR